MKRFLKRAILATATGLALAMPAQAQVVIQFWVSDGQAKRALVRDGYSQLKVVKRSLAKIHIEACKDAKKYHVRLDHTGRLLERNQIGTCRQVISLEDAAGRLASQGYRRINIRLEAGNYIAIACLRGKRQKITYDRFGDVIARRDAGSCKPDLDAEDVVALLRERGYDRVKMTDSKLPQYVAEACNDNKRFEIAVGRKGKIQTSKRIGNCAPPIDPKALPAILAKRGFDRVEIIDDRLPRYRAEACRGG